MKRSKFNLSHTQILSGRMGHLIPCGLVEVLPGDTFQHASQALIRAAPLATPPMHPVRIDVRHFFVPHRLVWDDWEDFITGGPDGMNASVFPTMNHGPEKGCVLDNLGVNPAMEFTGSYSALPLRGLNLIWNEFYRDQDLQTELVVNKGSGFDNTTSYVPFMRVAWEKDYFTTSRPWEQKGPDVTLPLGSTATATVTVDRAFNPGGSPTNPVLRRTASDMGGYKDIGFQEGSVTPDGTQIYLTGTGVVDLSTATAATVNDLRLAMALQRYEEARARFGSRYTEYLRYLGVRSSDARLQRPEYLGGARTNLQFSEVLSTNAPGSNTGPGQFGGHGIGANRTNRYRKFFEEHGYVFTLMHVMPQSMYPQGLFRTWNRRTKEDFFQRELQHIGQQEVLNKEVVRDHEDPDGIFGYQDRYDEYRRTESQVHGEFRQGGYLEDWTFARQLPLNVALNNDFIRAQPSSLPFLAWNEATLYCAIRHQLVARRILASKGSSFIF